jgi:SAM-dependent methyltransferase
MFFPEDVEPTDQLSNRRVDRLPGEDRAWAHFNAMLATRSAVDVFGRIHARSLSAQNQAFGNSCTPEHAQRYIDMANTLAQVGEWRRVVDLGCGDGFIASRLSAPEVVGVDCHEPHLSRLRREHPEREWICLDLDRDRNALPHGDAALLKDVFHHWPNRLVREWLAWARTCGKWRWVIFTQDRPHSGEATDCPLGGFRGMDLDSEAFRDLGVCHLADYLNKSVLILQAKR